MQKHRRGEVHGSSGEHPGSDLEKKQDDDDHFPPWIEFSNSGGGKKKGQVVSIVFIAIHILILKLWKLYNFLNVQLVSSHFM